MMMKPALAAFVAKLRMGLYPTVLEYSALCRENGDHPDEVKRQAIDYQERLAYEKEIAGRSSAENELSALQLMAELRGFRLGS